MDYLSNLIQQVGEYTVVSADRLRNLAHLCQHLRHHNVPGDFVECGVMKGGSAALMSRFLENRHLWLYDTFSGMPAPGPEDGDEAKKWQGKCLGTQAEVRHIMGLVGTSADCYTLQAGLFSRSFTNARQPGQVALLHCDADWYDSVYQVLDFFYPRVSDGGCIVLDDFGWWEGCRRAFYDFCKDKGIQPLLERVGDTQAFWLKGRRHRRDRLFIDQFHLR